MKKFLKYLIYRPRKIRKVNEIIERYNVKNNRKIALDVFIENRAGVCRHMALLVGALLELGVEKGTLKGTPRIVRNKVGEKNMHGVFFMLKMACI
ncbi:MAG: hypothetical protein QXJ06_02990 [Candidatus Aenigmatarchaeota archaeon]